MRPIAAARLRAAAGAAPTYLLDTYSGAVGAWSIARKLKTGISSVIGLRTNLDTNQHTIGVDGSGNTDEAAITTHYGGGTAVLEFIVDQSASGIDLYQATDVARPVVLNAGTLQKVGGRLAGIFSGSQFMDTGPTGGSSWGTTVGLAGDAAYSVFIVHKKTTTTGGCLFGWGNTGAALAATGYYDDNTFSQLAFAGGNAFNTTTPSNNTVYLTTIIKTAGQISTTTSIYRNGSSVAGAGHSTTTPNVNGAYPFAIGQWASYTAGARLIGSLQEVIVFAGDKSSDRAAIESAIRTYYGF